MHKQRHKGRFRQQHTWLLSRAAAKANGGSSVYLQEFGLGPMVKKIRQKIEEKTLDPNFEKESSIGTLHSYISSATREALVAQRVLEQLKALCLESGLFKQRPIIEIGKTYVPTKCLAEILLKILVPTQLNRRHRDSKGARILLPTRRCLNRRMKPQLTAVLRIATNESIPQQLPKLVGAPQSIVHVWNLESYLRIYRSKYFSTRPRRDKPPGLKQILVVPRSI